MHRGVRNQRPLARYTSSCGEHRESAVANGDPSAGARHLGNELIPQPGGIPWVARHGIRNQRLLARYALPCRDANASSTRCRNQ
ncbi:hypothetical protein RHMOL_Rhmol09G0164600 [Rhododendron molle]|uniref:Uncharacterized protein n=1 Tax=Rhododendron molle TaxID=49168 RepID=A0ACC0MEE2_RHOML|nr:hypothetical protein RHMOL_Rhmol09G0164600 [Rhododendron molle]